MKSIKTALSIGLVSAFITGSPLAKDFSEKKTRYEIRCSVFHVGDADYSIMENDKEYNIEMRGQPTDFFKFLGLEYQFHAKGYKKDGQLYPEEFKRVNKSGVSEDKKSCEMTEVTDIEFDYENLEAKAYAYKQTPDQLIVKYDTRDNPTKITYNTKDFLTISEEIRRKGLKDSYEIKTIAQGKLHSFEVRKIGEETISINGDHYSTAVYETKVTTDMFGIDSKAKIWVNQDEDHTILKWWIENGPLWASIVILYTGEKSDLSKN